MIEDLDIIASENGRILLAVPGEIPNGELILTLFPTQVTVAANGKVFVKVEDVPDNALEALAEQGQVGLIEIHENETDRMTDIHYHATVKDLRKQQAV